MIRPVTCVCFLLACGSGLYLYQSKHRVQMLDREIEKTVHATEELREQTRVLHAEWTLQNDPQRLQALADQFLTLKTGTPGQFTSMADLDNRLPPVRPPEPAQPAVPTVRAPGTTEPEEPQTPPVAAVPNPPPPQSKPEPKPEPKPAVVAVAPPPPHPQVEHKPAAPPRPVVAEVQPVRPAVVPRPVIATAISRPAAPVFAPAPVATGSSLGMARSGAVPPPTPMPVSASQWVTNGGGGG